MLLGNYSVLNKSPLKFAGGSTTSVEVGVPSNFSKSGNRRNRLFIDRATTALMLYAVPTGNYAGSAWFIPQRQGELVSRGTLDGVGSATATGTLGRNLQSALSGNGDVVSAVMQLVMSAVAQISGTSTLTVDLVGKLEATAKIAGSGDVVGVLGALATLLASLYCAGDVLGDPTALGSMQANIRGYGDLTPEGIKDAVWSASAAVYNASGTMGNKVNSAASGGVDYTALASAVRTELQAELLRIVEIAQLHGLVVGADLVVTATNRTAGSVVQTVATTDATTTITREL